MITPNSAQTTELAMITVRYIVLWAAGMLSFAAFCMWIEARTHNRRMSRRAAVTRANIEREIKAAGARCVEKVNREGREVAKAPNH